MRLWFKFESYGDKNININNIIKHFNNVIPVIFHGKLKLNDHILELNNNVFFTKYKERLLLYCHGRITTDNFKDFYCETLEKIKHLMSHMPWSDHLYSRFKGNRLYIDDNNYIEEVNGKKLHYYYGVFFDNPKLKDILERNNKFKVLKKTEGPEFYDEDNNIKYKPVITNFN